MTDVLDLFGRALAVFAGWLQSVALVPWPLVVGMLFLPLVAALRITLWILRGRVWPVPCKYYHTQQRRMDKECRVLVPGRMVLLLPSFPRQDHVRWAQVRSVDSSLAEARSPGPVGRPRGYTGVGFVLFFSNRVVRVLSLESGMAGGKMTVAVS